MHDGTLISSHGLVAETPGFDFSGAGLDVDIGTGQIVSIIGPDYTGKSEWLRTLAGVTVARSGSLTLLGKETDDFVRDDWVSVRRRLAYLRSDTAILSAANARQNVILPARYHRSGPASSIIERCNDLLDELGVEDRTSLPAYLRSDQRFKIAVARALILDPVALLLDSPFDRLDAMATEHFQQLLLRRVKEGSMTLVLVTHDVNFALRHSDQILFITSEQLYHFDTDEDIRSCGIGTITDFLNRNRVTC